MSARHTEGPWVICTADDCEQDKRIFAESQLVDGVVSANAWDDYVASAGLNHDNWEANLRLVAAAPELLAEAIALVAKLQVMAIHSSHYAGLTAAIAQAEGSAA